MQQIAVESMTAEELQALDLSRLGDALAESMVAIAECGREAISARVQLARIRASWARGDPNTPKGEHLAQVEEARALCDTIRLRAGSLRELKSTLQTLIRAHV